MTFLIFFTIILGMLLLGLGEMVSGDEIFFYLFFDLSQPELASNEARIRFYFFFELFYYFF